MTETVVEEDLDGMDGNIVPPMAGEMRKTNPIDQKTDDFGDMFRAEARVKTDAKEMSVKDKLMRVLGMRKEISHAKNSKKMLHCSDLMEAEKNHSLPEVLEPKTAHVGQRMHEMSGDDMDDLQMRREFKLKTTPLDNDRLTQRLTELETHVKEIHSAFDDFVLHSDQFLNYEQFLDVQNEVKEKIRLLDRLEKSLEESKNLILKDAGYMDQILDGFSDNKKKMESLESRLNAITVQISANNQLPPNNLLNILLPANSKYLSSAKAHDTGMISDMRKELDAFKKTEELKQSDFLKLQERIYAFDERINKISCDLETSRKMIDHIALKQTMPKSTDNKTAGFLPEKDVERMNTEMSEVRANIDRIKNALHGL